MSFISSYLYRKVANHAIKEGMKLSDFSDAPVPLNSVTGPQTVPADQFFDLHEKVDNALKPGFSVRVGQQMVIEDYGVLGLSWRTCSKAREIFERSERYFSLMTDTYVFKVEDEGDLTKLYLFREAYRQGVELSNEATFSATVVVLKAMTEKDIGPVSVSFKHGPPADRRDYDKYFNCPVQFNQNTNFMCYKKVDMDARTAKADESINKFLLERIEEEAKGMEVSTSKITADVKNLIKDALPSGIPSISQLGEHLGMSNRTLTRRLSESGFTFRDLIKKTQQEISIDLLKNTSRSVGEIAFQTGFSEQSAFNRAFKNWTGQSPASYRKN